MNDTKSKKDKDKAGKKPADLQTTVGGTNAGGGTLVFRLELVE